MTITIISVGEMMLRGVNNLAKAALAQQIHIQGLSAHIQRLSVECSRVLSYIPSLIFFFYTLVPLSPLQGNIHSAISEWTVIDMLVSMDSGYVTLLQNCAHTYRC